MRESQKKLKSDDSSSSSEERKKHKKSKSSHSKDSSMKTKSEMTTIQSQKQSQNEELHKFSLETHFRQVATDLINPIIKTQKTGLAEQNKQKDEIALLQSKVYELTSQNQKQQKEIDHIVIIQSRLTDLEQVVDIEKKRQKL